MSVADYIADGRCKCCGGDLATWTAAAVIDAIQAWADREGRPPNHNEWDRATAEYPNRSTVVKMFGCWNDGISAAGYQPAPRGGGASYWSRDRIADAMLDWLLVTGGWPTTVDWLHATAKHPCSRTVYEVFGSWRAGLLAAGWSRDCATCGGPLVVATARQLYCSRRCRARAAHRIKRGVPVADAAAPAVACAGCGGDLDSRTIGCKTCGNRVRKRRKLLSDGPPSRPGERDRVASPAIPVGGAPFTTVTRRGVADAPAAERREAA